jgi:hypothetical protein
MEKEAIPWLTAFTVKRTIGSIEMTIAIGQTFRRGNSIELEVACCADETITR